MPSVFPLGWCTFHLFSYFIFSSFLTSGHLLAAKVTVLRRPVWYQTHTWRQPSPPRWTDEAPHDGTATQVTSHRWRGAWVCTRKGPASAEKVTVDAGPLWPTVSAGIAPVEQTGTWMPGARWQLCHHFVARQTGSEAAAHAQSAPPSSSSSLGGFLLAVSKWRSGAIPPPPGLDCGSENEISTTRKE